MCETIFVKQLRTFDIFHMFILKTCENFCGCNAMFHTKAIFYSLANMNISC